MASSRRISVGIGSWADREYAPLLFAKGVKGDDRLPAYAEHFGHVEVNASYYAIPAREKIAGWVEKTPAAFRFDFKLHRVFSDKPEKAAGGNLLVQLLEKTKPLVDAGKLGAYFMVMPPAFVPGSRRLEELDPLLEKLRPHTLAVELRHRAWIDGEQRARTLEFFRSRKLTWIAVDMPQVEGSTIMPAVDEVTNPSLAYLRLHGRNREWPNLKTAEEKHAYLYSDAELRELATRVESLAAKAQQVHVVANNHAQDFAPKTALALQRLLNP